MKKTDSNSFANIECNLKLLRSIRKVNIEQESEHAILKLNNGLCGATEHPHTHAHTYHLMPQLRRFKFVVMPVARAPQSLDVPLKINHLHCRRRQYEMVFMCLTQIRRGRRTSHYDDKLLRTATH